VDATPHAVRQPAPNAGRPNSAENGERNREKSVRQPAPVVERPVRPPQPVQAAQPQSAGDDPEKKKKKKDKDGGQ
jgi:hypothetical protein